MKTWLKVLLGVIGVIVLAVAGALYFTSGVVKTGDNFFAAVRSGDMDQAYGSLSSAFRAGTSETELAAYLAANRMDRVSEASWSSRAASGGTGSLVGTLTTTEGESIPIEIDLVKEPGQWKIYAIRRTAGTAGISDGAKGLPGENQQVALIAESMGVFVDAVAAKDMTGFHDHISRLWAEQFDVAKLNDTYQAFYKAGSRLQIINTMAPMYEGPATLSDEGIMEIKGNYPLDTARLHFNLKYIYKGTG